VTVLNTESRLVGTAVGNLPRVNLLPPEIAEQAAFRKVQIGLGAALLATVGVVGMVYVSATHSVSSAKSDLASAQSQTTVLRGKVTKLSNVTALYSKAAAAEAMLQGAMGDEIRYSQLLNDLSLAVPSNVWLKNLTYASTSAAAAPTATALPNGAVPVGTFTVTGMGFNHDDVAVWLESLSGLKGYVNPYFSSSTESLIGTRKVVSFSSTATVISTARSNRYNKPVGG
jgi:Tfp pilus assembly protein PilN